MGKLPLCFLNQYQTDPKIFKEWNKTVFGLRMEPSLDFLSTIYRRSYHFLKAAPYIP